MELKKVIEEIKLYIDADQVFNKIVGDLGLNFKNGKCKCFMHSPSADTVMSYDKKLKKLKCFSCGQSYDIFNHYQQHNGLNFVNAINEIVRDFNLNIDIVIEKTDRKPKKSPKIHENYNNQVLGYCEKRGISKETIDYVGIKENKGSICFEYRNELGEHISNKYRRTKSGDGPKMWFEKDTNINTLFNMDKVNISEPLLITEGECLTGETEVMTPYGWVRLDEYNNQEVMAVSDNMSGKFEMPLAYIKKEYNSVVFEYRNRNYSFAGTPNHNVVYMNNGKVIKRELVDMPNTIVGFIPTAINVSGNGIGLTINQIALYLAISADASIDFRKNGNMYVKFGFKKDRKKERLIRLLECENIKYSSKNMNDGRLYIYFTAPNWFKSKKLPTEWIRNATFEQRRFIIEEMVFWDGNTVNNRLQYEYSSKEIFNAEFMQMIAHTCGYNSTIMKRKNDHGSWYKVSILLGKNSVSWQNMKKYKSERFVEKVYCVTVSTGMILIRNNGKISITGNCDTLAAIESGFRNSVSIPSGVNSTNEWITTNWNWLEQFEEIILWFDNDEAGIKGVRDVFNRLQNRTVKIVRCEEANDINELLHKTSKLDVLGYIAQASTPLLDGIATLDIVEDFDIFEAEKLETGIESIDNDILGMVFGSLNVLSGRNGAGKSTILNQIYIGESIRQGYKTFLFSGELVAGNIKEWLLRTLANDNHLIDYKAKNGDTYKRVSINAKKDIVEKVKDKFFLYDSDNYNVDTILEKMNVLATRYGVKVFVIDNLMTIEDSSIDEYKAQSNIVKKLKNFAKKYNAMVHLVAHPRKSMSENIGKDDVAGSANITNLADYVTTIERKFEQDREYDADLSILKNRHTGVNSKASLKFDSNRKRFYSSSEMVELKMDYLQFEQFEQVEGGWE